MLWISAQRRQHRVFKTYQLERSKTYIRVDEKVLKAFILMTHERYASDYEEAKMVHFKEVDGILMGHLTVKSAHSLLLRTKSEIEMILQGYPPFYLESLRIPDTAEVPNPLPSSRDTKRGGWIVGIGLDIRGPE